MSQIIDERPRPAATRLPLWLALASVLAGAAAWTHYTALGIVLSHYDTKGHLVVARRVLDGLTPGWQQIGAVWLPLPHLLNLLPVHVDWLYRTGLSASLISILSLALAIGALARLVLRSGGSPAAAITGAVVLGANPNLLYLQTTPMTEPLLLGLGFLAVALAYDWVASGDARVPAALGWTAFATAWTRYEAWPLLAALGALTALAWWRAGRTPLEALLRTARFAAWPVAAALLFLLNSKITVGSWFVSDGFFVPDAELRHLPHHDLGLVVWGTAALGGRVLTATGLTGALVIAVRGFRRRESAAALVALAPLAMAALPAIAFFQGHPFRVRYMVPDVAAMALVTAVALGALPRRAWVTGVAGVALTLAALVEVPPLSARAPMVLEAQWDRPRAVARRAVTACLAPAYRGERVMASMGSLAHYMQELSADGFDLADFVHEGTGVIWQLGMERGPAVVAGWMLTDQQSEGGDELTMRMRTDPEWADGMVRVCEGGGVALYRRQAPAPPAAVARR